MKDDGSVRGEGDNEGISLGFRRLTGTVRAHTFGDQSLV